MKRSERKVLEQAAGIISRELSEGREVRIPRFGLFRLSAIEVCLEHPMSEEYLSVPLFLQDKVSFRPFDRLKKLVRNRRKVCPKKRKTSSFGNVVSCYHKEGEGHDGPCVDWRGRPYNDEERMS